MMPSRGLHIARGNTPRLFQLQCRHLSSASRQTPRIPPVRIATEAPLLPSQQWRRRTWLATPAIAAIRHASTTPTPSPAQAAATVPPPAAETAPVSDVSSITLDDVDLTSTADLANIPEKIGFLHQMGIDYWYGPTSMLEWFLEHVHVYSGLPWWGSLATTALIIRAVMFPMYLKASDISARQSALVSVTKPFIQRMSAARNSGDQAALMQAWQELAAVRKSAGISTMQQMMPLLVQGVIGYCTVKLLRAMANLPVPGLQSGGFSWLTDLTLPDPYGIMPLLMGGALHLLFRLGGETGSADTAIMTPGMRRFTLYGMPGIVILVMAWMPGALCVWFTATGGISMAQALLLQRPAVREYFGIAPIYKPTKEEGNASPFASMMESMYPAARASKERESKRPSIDVGRGGKNAAYMQPQWQAPNLHTKAGSLKERVIDVQATNKSAEAPKSKGGVMGAVRDMQGKFSEGRQMWRDQIEARREKSEKLAKRRAAEDYERRAREREGRR